MLSVLGKLIRKWRIDNGKTLYMMASGLDVSSAFLSAVETGKKKAPSDLLQKIKSYMNLNDQEGKELERAALQSQKEIKIDMHNIDETGQELVACFARRIDSLSESEKKKILSILR